jgi:hypothetical protein
MTTAGLRRRRATGTRGIVHWRLIRVHHHVTGVSGVRLFGVLLIVRGTLLEMLLMLFERMGMHRRRVRVLRKVRIGVGSWR